VCSGAATGETRFDAADVAAVAFVSIWIALVLASMLVPQTLEERNRIRPMRNVQSTIAFMTTVIGASVAFFRSKSEA
jgi:uncharacterized protein (UPF0261 family)